MNKPLRAFTGLCLLAAALGVSACAGLIDENAELNPRVLETPGVNSAMESNYPRGSANPYQGDR